MVTRKRWTIEEEEILVQAITANPHNIKQACEEASNKLTNRTKNSCVNHWYQVMAPLNKPAKLGVSFVTVGSKTICNNRKNTSISVKPSKFTLWDKLKRFLNF